MATLTEKKLDYLQGTKDAIKNALIEKGQAVSSTDTFRSYADKIRGISGSGGGVPTGYKTVTFMNGDNVLFERLVLNGDDCPDPVTQGRIETPTKESTVQYNYTYKGWSEALTNITEDKVIYATYTETVRTYTVTFYDEDGTTVLHTEQVAYGGSSTYTYEKEGYLFSGWTPSPTNITGNLDCYGAWAEGLSFASASWEDIAQISESGNASETFALGDTRRETLTYADGTTEEVELMIAAFDRLDKNGKPTITIINKQLLSKTSAYTSKSSSKLSGDLIYHSPDADTIKSFFNDTITPALPITLQNVLREGYCFDNMFGSSYYYKIAPLTFGEVGINDKGEGEVANETLYSFDATAESRKRTNNTSASYYWLYDFCSTKNSSSTKGAGSVGILQGEYSEQIPRQQGAIMFKIFV